MNGMLHAQPTARLILKTESYSSNLSEYFCLTINRAALMMWLLSVYMCSVILVKFNSEKKNRV